MTGHSVISLLMFRKHRMSDNTLTTLMGHVPSRYGSPSVERFSGIQFIPAIQMYIAS